MRIAVFNKLKQAPIKRLIIRQGTFGHDTMTRSKPLGAWMQPND
jgi:hypothetical protein